MRPYDRRLQRWVSGLLAALAAWGTPPVFNGIAFGQTEPVAAAIVANEVVTVAEAEGLYARMIGDRTLDDDVRLALQAESLETLVGQLLVVEYLRGTHEAASADDVQLELDRWQQELATVDQTLDQYLADEKLSREGLLNRICFRLSWRRYLEAKLTDVNLRKHFENYRRELDGTELNVSHLLVKTADQSSDEVNAILERLAELRGRIESGTISWGDAVARHSQAPTRDEGGSLGWIRRSGPMPETFSAAAFRLESGQISLPTRTPFGYHLIRCDEVKPGQITFEQARDEVRKHATRYLFGWIVERQREKTPPRYTGAYPHRDLATGNAIPASGPRTSPPR
jgi:parvulin-like peptidyl-prolyl isomerase